MDITRSAQSFLGFFYLPRYFGENFLDVPQLDIQGSGLLQSPESSAHSSTPQVHISPAKPLTADGKAHI